MACHAMQVKLSFSGTGEAAFAGVALFAHPDVACRCEAGYYLDVSSAPVRKKTINRFRSARSGPYSSSCRRGMPYSCWLNRTRGVVLALRSTCNCVVPREVKWHVTDNNLRRQTFQLQIGYCCPAYK